METQYMQEAKLHEECGVFGVADASGQRDVVGTTYMALYALQHRGQMSCGIAVSNDGVLRGVRDRGLVPDVLDQEALSYLGQGQIAIGHVRYGTQQNADRASAQPLVLRHIKGNFALCFNGALTNAVELRRELELDGAIFHTLTDCEVIAHVFTRERLRASSTEEALERAMGKLKGAYSIVMMSARKLIAARDPKGFRPLCIGRLGDSYAFSSESCAIDALGGELVRDVEPGEIVVVKNGELSSITTHCGQKSGLCVFEFVYFARPDSVIDGSSVHEARQRAGAYLALEHPVAADVVVGVPDSGLDAALGYARQSGIPYGIGLIKNRYIGRTFIEPTQTQRENAVRIKLNAVRHVVEGKRVVLIDDSIVRGTTSARIVGILREAGAKEVHMRISSPPFLNPCYFGTDIDSKDKLIACRLKHDEIAKAIGVDSLGYLSVDNIKKIALNNKREFCVGCFTGEYPVDPPKVVENDKFSTPISLNEQSDDKEV